jgi:antirestriction protein ArdC
MASNFDVYESVQNTILDALDQGIVPWRRPWSEVGGLQRNLNSNRPYRGVNQFLLSIKAMQNGWESPFWLTGKAVKKMGGSTREDQWHKNDGPGSTLVVLWKRIKIKVNADEPGAIEVAPGQFRKVIPIIRFYNVWNVEQCEGIEIPVLERPKDFEPIVEAERIVAEMPNRPKLIHGGMMEGAWYAPLLDTVRLPKREDFDSPAFYYNIAFHELSHSTGHESRLNRPEIAKFTGKKYAESYSNEELVAEMSAAFLCGVVGIERETLSNTAAYIDHWRRKISEDKKLVVMAGAKAQKAADYIQGVTFDENPDETPEAKEMATA